MIWEIYHIHRDQLRTKWHNIEFCIQALVFVENFGYSYFLQLPSWIFKYFHTIFFCCLGQGISISLQKIFCITRKLETIKWDKLFKSGKIIICGKQPLKIWRDLVCLSRPYPFKFFKTVFHKFYLVHSWILCPKCFYAYHSLHSPFLLGKVKPPTKFSGRGGLRRPSFLEGVTGKEVGGLFEMGGGCNFYIKNNQFNGSKKCIFGNVITFKKFRERKFRETKTCSKL